MNYDLPKSLTVGGAEYEIRSDYRDILEICAAMNDQELSDEDKALVALEIMFPAFDTIPPEHYQEAINKCFWFINCGDEGQNRKSPKLMDWEQDFQYIVAPVNRVMGAEIRAMEYLHWWSFISAYYEIGDCLFAQIVRIREMKAKGKPLDKSDQEFYRRNREIIDLKTTYTEREDAILKQWGV